MRLGAEKLNVHFFSSKMELIYRKPINISEHTLVTITRNQWHERNVN